MLETLRHILEMIRFSHTVFALPFALLAAVMAWTVPLPASASTGSLANSSIGFRWLELSGILVCMVFARSAAMAFNRIVDRRIDAMNPRTERRHLAVGKLTMPSVVGFTVVSSIGFVAATLLFLPNVLPILLSLPVLAFLFAYSYTKRFTSMAHFWLGAALMLAPICTWIAIRGEFLLVFPPDILPAALLGLVVLFWVTGFDIIYACQDFEFDSGIQLHSIPVWLGIPGALKFSALCHALMLGVLALLPWLCPQVNLGWVYAVGVLMVTVLLIYEHRVVRPDDLSRVNLAFFRVNAIVSIGLFAVVTIDLFV